jgi:hypothetical protein
VIEELAPSLLTRAGTDAGPMSIESALPAPLDDLEGLVLQSIPIDRPGASGHADLTSRSSARLGADSGRRLIRSPSPDWRRSRKRTRLEFDYVAGHIIIHIEDVVRVYAASA